MPRVINRNFSRYHDISTKTDFDSVLDRQTGCYVAVAVVDRKTATDLAKRNAGFEVVSDADWLAMTSVPEPPEEEPDPTSTGDPVIDAANAAKPTPAANAAPAAPAQNAQTTPAATANPSGDPLDG